VEDAYAITDADPRSLGRLGFHVRGWVELLQGLHTARSSSRPSWLPPLERDRIDKVFFLKVLNASSHLISVTHCVGYDKHIFRWRWLRLLLRQPEAGYMFAFETLNKLRLPYKIEAWDHQLFLYTIDERFPRGHLYVITADDRNHFCPRANIKAIHADEMYKNIHPDERSAHP
jgi:hypothetical protein